MNLEIETILKGLRETPRILKELIIEIDPKVYKEEIIKGKWSIHENATHIAVGDKYGIQKRLQDFSQIEHPTFEPLSGDNFPDKFFIELDLFETLEEFFITRQATIELVYALNKDNWDKEANHPEYKRYTPYFMLRHLLMHDHWHLYQIEDLGLRIKFG